MTSSIKKLKNSEVELVVVLNKEDLLKYASEAEKGLAEQIQIGGFRPGKAPKEMVRKHLGEKTIREEALSLAVQASLAKALSEQELEVIEQTDLKIKENKADRLIYEVKLLVFPEIKLGDYKNINVKKNTVSVTEAEVNSVLDDVVKSRTVLKEVERPAKLGDKVEVDFEVRDKGTLIDGGKSENHPVILGENKFIPGFEAEIVGMKAGEKREFSLKAPDDYFQKTIAGKELDFAVTVKRIEERIAPKLDDEFARSLGKFSSKSELEENVKAGLTLEKETREKERVRLAILKEIADKTAVSLPMVLVEKRLDSMIQGFDNELHQKGMELGLYLAHIKKTQDDLRRDWHSKAEEQVKLGLVAQAVAKAERLRVSEEDVDAELQVLLQQYMLKGGPDGGPGGPEVLQNLDPEQTKHKIRDMLLNEKVFEFLEKHTKFTQN